MSRSSRRSERPRSAGGDRRDRAAYRPDLRDDGRDSRGRTEAEEDGLTSTSAARAEPQSSTPESPANWEERKMKLSRRGLISVVSALAATTMAFAAPARAADTKEIVYLTPGPRPAVLALSLERHRVGSQEGRLFLHGARFAQQRRDPAQECAGRDRARRRRHRDFADRQLDRAKRSRRSPRARRFRSSSRTSAPTAATMSRSSSPTIIRARIGVGEALAAALKDKGWTDGSVGLITISQARKNGQARTAGFRDAMKTAGHHQGGRPAADAVLYR